MANADNTASVRCHKGLLSKLPAQVNGWVLKAVNGDVDPCDLQTIRATVAEDRSPTLALYRKANIVRELILQTDPLGRNNAWGSFWFEIIDYEMMVEGDREVMYEIGNSVEHSFNLRDAVDALRDCLAKNE